MQDNVFKKFAKSVGIAASTEILLRLKDFALMPIITKTLGAINYGVWAQVGIITSLIQPIATMGLPNGLYRYLPGKEKLLVRREYYTVIVIVLISTLFWCALIFLFSKKIASTFFETTENAVFVVLAGVSIVVGSLKYLFTSYFRLFTWAKTYSLFTLIEAFGIAVFVGFAVYRGYGILGAVYMQLGVLALIVLLASIVVFWNLGLALPTIHGLKKYFAYGVPLIPTSWFHWVLNSSDRFVISYYLGLKDVGVYSLVYNVGYFLVGFIFNPIFLFYSPMVAQLWNEGRKEKVREMMEYTVKYGLMLAIPAVFGFYALGKQTLLLLSTEEFAGGVSLIPFVSLGYIFFLLSTFYQIIIGLAEKTTVVPFVFGFCAMLNIALTILMVPRIGILGAALATAISFGAQISFYGVYSRRFFKFKLCVGFIVKSILASAVMASFVYFVIPHSSVVEILLSAVAGGLLYFAILFLTKSFSKRELLFFRGLVWGMFKKEKELK